MLRSRFKASPIRAWVSGPCLLVLPPLPYFWLARHTRLGRIAALTVVGLMLALDAVALVCLSTTGAWARVPEAHLVTVFARTWVTLWLGWQIPVIVLAGAAAYGVLRRRSRQQTARGHHGGGPGDH